MSRHRKLWTVAPNVASEPNFEVVLRGYDRAEVDKYARALEAQVTGLLAENDEAQAQIRSLTGQLNHAQTEVIDLRRRPAIDEKVAFRHLGLYVERLLGAAEEQADTIKEAAVEEAKALRDEADRILAEARNRNNQAVRDLEATLSGLRTESAKELDLKRRNAEAAAARAADTARRLEEDAEAVLARAHEEAQRLTESSVVDADRLRAQAVAQAQDIRRQADQETAALAAAAEQYAHQTRAAAEQHARQTRDAAEQHARQTRAAAEEAATQVRAQAEQHAAEVRSGSEAHAARLHAAAEQVRRAAEKAMPPEKAPAEKAMPPEKATSAAGQGAPAEVPAQVDGDGAADDGGKASRTHTTAKLGITESKAQRLLAEAPDEADSAAA